MKKKSGLILIIGFLTMFKCGCPETGIFYYKYSDLSSYNLSYSKENSLYEYRACYDDHISSCEYENYGIRLDFDVELLAQQKRYGFNFGQSCYAFSECEVDEYYPFSEIAEFKLKTLYDFDKIHPANTDITDYFWGFQGRKTWGTLSEESITSIKELPLIMKYSIYNYNMNITLLLMKPPSMGSTLQFEVQVLFKDNTSIIDTTREIKWL